MFEDSNEETDFWSNVPDRRLDRFRRPSSQRAPKPRTDSRPAGARTHGDHTGAIPVVTTPTERPHQTRANGSAPIDPLLKRLGVLAVVIAVLVPVALSFRSDDTGSVGPTQADAASLSTLDATAASDTAAVAGDSADPTDPWAGIDVNALPPAVPVNPDPTSTAAAATQEAAPASASTAAISAPAVARAEAKVATTNTCPKKYTVASGDAWILIAQRAKITLKSLLATNGASTSTPLYPGRSICLPANAVKPVAKPATTPTAKPVVKAPSTTVPKATTTTAPKPPTRTYTKAQVIKIIRDVWPDNLEDKAIAIATRESNLTPAVKNYCCYGLFQIYYKVHKNWLATIGITSAWQLYDPHTNAYAAYVMYLRSGGWGPWGG